LENLLALSHFPFFWPKVSSGSSSLV
jgi:hypothetical protein